MAFFFGSDLWDEMSKMQRQLESLSDEVELKRPRIEGGSGKEVGKCQAGGSCKKLSFFHPCMDLAETEENYIVSMDLPGVKKEELTVSVNDGLVTITGKRQHKFVCDDACKKKDEAVSEVATGKKEEKPKHKVIKMESFFGCFERSVSVPAGVKPSDVHAKFENGVLTLTISKPRKQEMKKIEIQ